MARRERRTQPRLPIDLEIQVDPQSDVGLDPVQLHLRTRNLNIRGAFIELPEPGNPPPPWSKAEWWKGRLVSISIKSDTLGHGDLLICDAEVRWVERRGPKRRPVGIGVLFLRPSDTWLRAIQEFLDSLVT
jgi:hypothetical protein